MAARKRKVNKKAAKKKAAKKTPKKMGRPRLEIDWKKVDAMAQIHCTHSEIASVLDVSEDTLCRAAKRDKGCTFADYIAKKRENGRASLRRNMWLIAMKGNVAMNIFMAKNWLGMSDEPEPEEQAEGEMIFDIEFA